jgi:spore photoproduct lyase
LNPEPVADSLEHRAPPIKARLSALKKLAKTGWKVGLRFDPLIHFENGIEKYSQFIDQVFDSVPPESIHSVTLGTFRSPKNVFKKMESLYPKEPLFMGNLQLKNGAISYREAIEQALFSSVEEKILQYISPSQYFPCQ